MQLYLDFHHHTIFVSCLEESLLQKVREEFHFFVSPKISGFNETIELKLEESPKLPSLVAKKILEQAIIYQAGSTTFIDYFGKAMVVKNDASHLIQIYSEDEDRLYELGFLAIHSLLGQGLDLKGMCRLHALGVSLRQKNALVMLPSKGGKSTLLTQLMEYNEMKIISDDMPLIDMNGKVHPFPSKVSLNLPPSEGSLKELQWQKFTRTQFPIKWTASLAQLKEKIDRECQSNPTFLVAGHRLSSGSSSLNEVPKWKMIGPMLEHMIIGFGLPQILEMFLHFHFNDLFKMIHHAYLRSICAFQLVRTSKCYYFYMGPDIKKNAQSLVDLMNEK